MTSTASANDVGKTDVAEGLSAAGDVLRLITAKEFSKIHQGDPPWIIKPLMCEGSVTMLYGHQGRGKTSIAWQVAVSVVRGTSWMGFRVERPGPVIFLETDMDHREMQLLLKRADASGLV